MILTDKQFEFIMQSLRKRLLDAIHDRAFPCDVNPTHSCPDYRRRLVVDAEDVDSAVRIAFNEIMEEEI